MDSFHEKVERDFNQKNAPKNSIKSMYHSVAFSDVPGLQCRQASPFQRVSQERSGRFLLKRARLGPPALLGRKYVNNRFALTTSSHALSMEKRTLETECLTLLLE